MPGPYPQFPTPIEALSEYDVQEILLDGREILEKFDLFIIIFRPPTPTEYFQKIINRIDFNKVCQNGTSGEVPDRLHESGPSSLQLWTNVREASRMALTELNAFVDVLAILKEEKYLSVFPVAYDPSDSKKPSLLVGKKGALSLSAEVLLKGAERLRQRHSEIVDAKARILTDQEAAYASFHHALIQLRQEWRLRLHQNAILGDVSLRSVGSRFRETGNFEVRQSDLVAQMNSSAKESLGPVDVVFSRSVEAFFANSCSRDLDIFFHETGHSAGPSRLWKLLSSTYFDGSSDQNLPNQQISSPRQRLARIQRLLACREILSQLAYEAASSKGNTNLLSEISTLVDRDQVIIGILPGVQVVIRLPAKGSAITYSDQGSMDTKPCVDSSGKQRATSVLTNSLCLQLHRLLSAEHRAAWSNVASVPQCACEAVQIPLRCRAAGAHALTVDHFDPSGHEASWFSIPVASVAGFAGPAAAAWSAFNPSTRSSTQADRSVPSTASSTQRLPSASITQDRLALFTEWGSLQPPGGGLASSANPFDDSVHGTAKVCSVEQQLNKRCAGDRTVQSVIGSTSSFLDRTVKACRHNYLRRQVFDTLTNIAFSIPIRMVVHWDGVNSALHTSVRLCFYVVNYDVYRSWLSLSISHSGITVFHANPPRTCYIGMDLPRLRAILLHQVILTELLFLDVLLTKILGWTRIGHNPFSGLACPTENLDGPAFVKMYASSSGQRTVCIQATPSLGLRLFVGEQSANDSGPNKQFREVNLSAVPGGPQTVGRIETILSLLT